MIERVLRVTNVSQFNVVLWAIISKQFLSEQWDIGNLESRHTPSDTVRKIRKNRKLNGKDYEMTWEPLELTLLYQISKWILLPTDRETFDFEVEKICQSEQPSTLADSMERRENIWSLEFTSYTAYYNTTYFIYYSGSTTS